MAARASDSQLSLFESTAGAAKKQSHPGDRAALTTRHPQVAQRSAVLTAQPELPFVLRSGRVLDPGLCAALEQRLVVSLGSPLGVTVTDNRRTMISIRRRDGKRHVRLHHMFLDAPSDVIEAVGRYLARGDRFASKMVDGYIAANQTRIKAPSDAPPPRLQPRGDVYDLDDIQDALSARYFDGAVRVDITWGRNASGRRQRGARRTIRMGTYFIDEKLIRIHPALDQPFVPRYFVEWVVYHEMLHHVVPMPMVKGRRVYHSAEFRTRERLYEQFERARAWEESNLRRLIASRNVAASP